MGVQISLSLCFESFGHISRNGIGRSHGNSIFKVFFRNHHTVFHSRCTISHSHQKHTSVPVSSRSCPHLHIFLFDSSYPNGCEGNRYFLSAYCVPSNVVDIVDTVVNKMNKPCP